MSNILDSLLHEQKMLQHMLLRTGKRNERWESRAAGATMVVACCGIKVANKK